MFDNGKKVLITQSNYIPWKGYFDAINVVDELILLDDVQFTKRDWRNRNTIKTPNGLQWLTIPVKVKGRFTQKINETEILDDKWAIKHWNVIKTNYSNALYFSYYKNIFESLYINIDKTNLSEINVQFIKLVCSILDIKTTIRMSSEFEILDGKTERLLHICKQIGAKEYYTGPSAKNYLNEDLFKAEDVNVNYLDFTGYPAYRQLFGEFIHNVSIIDLLFNEGAYARDYMKSFNNKYEVNKSN